MKNKISIFILLTLVLGATAWGVLRNQKATKEIIPTPIEEKKPQNNTTNTETITLPSEKPASFTGVEMTTYRNELFELTFPKKWKKNETTLQKKEDNSFYYSITPDIIYPRGIPKGILNPLFSIDVEDTDKKSLQPDASIGEKSITINKRTAVYFSGDGADAYYFLHNKKLYSIHMITGYETYDTFKEEALWVLSTFRIVE